MGRAANADSKRCKKEGKPSLTISSIHVSTSFVNFLIFANLLRPKYRLSHSIWNSVVWFEYPMPQIIRGDGSEDKKGNRLWIRVME